MKGWWIPDALCVYSSVSLLVFFFSAFDVMKIRLIGGKFLSFQCAFFLVASWELHQDVANSFLSIVQTKSTSFSFLYFSCHCLNRIEKQSRFMSWHFLSLCLTIHLCAYILNNEVFPLKCFIMQCFLLSLSLFQITDSFFSCISPFFSNYAVYSDC